MSDHEDLISSLRAWAHQEPEFRYREMLLTLLGLVTSGDDDAIAEAKELFGSRLTFGTAGIRGPMQAGPGGINRIVVSQTTAGLMRYLLEQNRSLNPEDLLVVIGFDGRHHSEAFAKDTAEVVSGQGVRALVLPRLLPTPLLAFTVRALGADFGVMVTASHNPPEDNGYKVYQGGRDNGSQVVSPTDRDIESHIREVAMTLNWGDIPRSRDRTGTIPESIVDDYLEATRLSLLRPKTPASSLKVVYTAMHGVGGETFLRGLAALGLPHPVVVKEQFEPDGDFPTVSFPNPEEKGALDLSIATARKVSADMIIAHDPDADRLAVALPRADSEVGYQTLTGNQLGAILGWWVAERAKQTGQSGTLANSVVSSPVLGKIAKHFSLNHEETLTGFKYVSRVENLIFGFEEALGYLVTPDVVRDKDGISAGLLMVSLANTLANEGRTLWDYLRQIEESVGAFASGQVTIRLTPGVAGSTVIKALRERTFSELGSRCVTRRDDFLEGVGNFPKEDILRYYLDDGTRVIARPSGTEPKVKVYIDTEGTNSADAQSRLTEVESDVNELVNSL